MNEVIKTVRDVHRMGHEQWVRQRLAAMGRLDAMPAATSPDVMVGARIDHGRWIVDCPFCPAAELADLLDLRFFCTDRDCLNKGAPHLWLSVAVPAPELRLAIEAALLALPENRRHWRGG